MELNRQARRPVDQLLERAELLNIAVTLSDAGTRLVDCGVRVTGGLEAGRLMAKACLADLAEVAIGPGDRSVWPGPWVTVRTDQPVAACLASQYAGWPVRSEQAGGESYFAMASGPMRAARGREPLFEKIGGCEQATAVVGILESGRLPPPAICRQMADECHVSASDVTLLIAPTSSLAGTVQVVARSVETALHKMLELGFSARQFVAGFGTAPLPPVASDDLTGIGRTNDAVLYGARVTIWLCGDESPLPALGARIPSCASRDHGRPFAEIFRDYDQDFYKIDPLLFSPAEVELVHLDSGKSWRFGQLEPQLLKRSFEVVEHSTPAGWYGRQMRSP